MSPSKLLVVLVLYSVVVSRAVVISTEWQMILKQICKENENICMSVPAVREVFTFSSVSGQLFSSTEVSY